MPFIDPDFLSSEKNQVQRILITSADDSDVVKTSFELGKLLARDRNPVLWVDGNLGEHSMEEEANTALDNVLEGQLPITELLKEKEGVVVLEGFSKYFFAELSETKQYQLLQDLRNVYSNFNKVILTVDGKNPVLQQKWMNEAESIYLLFNCKNLFLNRTLSWLKENTQKTKGLIGIGKNDQEVLLTYMRLKNILNEIPKLVLDIKEIAP